MAHAHVMVHRLIFVHPFHLHMVHVHSIGYLHLWMCSVVHAMMLMLCVGIKIYEKRCCDYYKYFFHHSSLSSVKLKGLCKKVYAARSRFFFAFTADFRSSFCCFSYKGKYRLTAGVISCCKRFILICGGTGGASLAQLYKPGFILTIDLSFQ